MLGTYRPTATIAARAAFPHERRNTWVPDDEPTPAGRRDQWARHALGSDRDSSELDQALDELGIDPSTSRSMMSDGHLTETPEWVAVLEAVLAGTSDAADLADAPTIPFSDVLAPFAAWFDTAIDTDAWGPETAVSLRRSLLIHLSRWASRPLYREFRAGAGIRSSLDDVIARSAGQPASKDEYRAFTERMANGGLIELFDQYPALARCCAQVTTHHARAAQVFADRLRCDRDALAAAFGGGSDLGAVTSVDNQNADPHNGGQLVSIVTFASGVRVVYKPRTVGMEAAFSDLLRWCNGHGLGPDLFAPVVLDRGDHGWMEFIERQDCADQNSVDEFYVRTGILLCFIHMLEGTDCHHENIVARGAHPVLVDAETLLHHRFSDDAVNSDANAMDRAGSIMERSPLRTAYLPQWGISRDRRVAMDMSGIAGGSDGRPGEPILHWDDANTDRMTFTYRPVVRPTGHNRPRTVDGVADASTHHHQVREGFRLAYEFVTTHRSAMVAPAGPVTAFRGRKTRIVLRPTMIYGGILTAMMDGEERLRNGFDTGIVIEQLARAYLHPQTSSHEIEALDSERAGLCRLDVPVFWARSDATDLVGDDGRCIENYFPRASFDSVVERIGQMGDSDLDGHLEVIDAAMSAGTTHRSKPADADALRDRRRAGDTVVADLRDTAIRGSDGSLIWIAPQLVAATEQLALRPLTASLYDGVGGLAVFFAAVHATSGDQQARDDAIGCWLSVRNAIGTSSIPGKPLSYLGYGAATGIGSVLHAAVLLDHFLPDDGFLGDVESLVAGLDLTSITSDHSCDLMSGTAGLLIGLLNFHQRTGDQSALDRAIDCGEHLLDIRVLGSGRYRAWNTVSNTMLTGASHGAAGIAQALLRLYEATGDDRFLTGAIEGVDYENSLFDAAAQNWPDLRTFARLSADREAQCAWCHGAPGIALARLGFDKYHPIDTDIDAAVACIAAYDAGDADLLCCGKAGIADVLLTVGRALGREGLVAAADEAITKMLERAAVRGCFQYSELLPAGVFMPGLFAGAAGIGYQLLRHADPDSVPSLLAFSAP